MSGANLPATYSERINHFAGAVRGSTKQINLFSIARLVVLISMVWFLVLGIKNNTLLFYLLSAFMFVLFLFLVSIFNRVNGERELFRQLQKLNEKELACLVHEFHDFPDGSEHADISHPWSHDLDLFGTGSLFQYLNRTSTLTGSKVLAEMLTSEPGSAEGIVTRQHLMKDLKERLDFRQHFTASGALIKETPEDLRNISQWLETNPYISKYPWLFYLAMGVSLLSLSVITAVVLDSSRFLLLLFPLVLNMLIISPFLLRTQRYQEVISRKHDLLKGYAGLLKQFASTAFSHPELQGKSSKAREGMSKVAGLSKLLQIFDQRLNMFMGSLLNGLFLFDFIMLHLLERWKKKNRENIMEWIEITGWMDAMISLSGFAWNHPDFCMPQLNDKQDNVEFQKLGHPLIPLQKRVSNDLEITGEKVVVITGANMAGKSTFLRSLGVNMVLAYTGCPVCASTFRSSYMGLHSSMRTADSLKDEESYFLAEIRKLQQIVLEMESGKPMLILLDEVLKGTNTTDKKLGSVGLIRKALKYPVRCFIATHDLSLGDLENEHEGRVVNYCFESYIEDMELSFDYTIRRGIATNMNASFLMKKMGIVD